jgi:hypothetical protein
MRRSEFIQQFVIAYVAGRSGNELGPSGTIDFILGKAMDFADAMASADAPFDEESTDVD